ncbi:MAG: porin [Methyloglobulus sp.]|nr:porin [Methyloglobulus sp.]
MTLSKLTLAIATALSVGASYNSYAMDLYVDTKTKQIFAEPGPGRELMGSFEKTREPSATPAQSTDDISAIKQDLELKSNEIAALKEHAKEAEENKIHLDDGLELKTKDGNFKVAINGRMQVDSQVNVNDGVVPGCSVVKGFNNDSCTSNQLADGVGLRRARLGVEGTFFHDFDYKFEYDFTRGNGTIGAGVTDAFLRWNYDKAFSVKIGSFKEPFSLEEATSNRFLTFIERNMIVNTFVDNPNTYKVGIGANYSQERYQIATSFQTEPVGANGASASSINTNGGSNRNNGSGDTGWEANARISGMPWMESKTKFLHVGASGSYVDVNNQFAIDKDGKATNSGGFSFVSALNNNVDRTNILNTGNLTKADGSRRINSFTRFGAETALVYGPWSAQAEYIQTNISGTGYDGETLDGYYGYVSYFLTGESRGYKSKTGAWDRLKPNRNFDLRGGGWGAWEVAAGYDYIDLNDGVIQGGRASTAKFGLNWYPNSHFRVMSNFVHVLDLNSKQRGFNDADLDMFEMRAQVDF